jgi:hypothetical protein
VTEREVKDWYGVPSDAYLPRNAIDLHGLAVRLYAAWLLFECKREFRPEDGFAPAQFFHIATELCSMARRGNFHSAEHILWSKA